MRSQASASLHCRNLASDMVLWTFLSDLFRPFAVRLSDGGTSCKHCQQSMSNMRAWRAACGHHNAHEQSIKQGAVLVQNNCAGKQTHRNALA